MNIEWLDKSKFFVLAGQFFSTYQKLKYQFSNFLILKMMTKIRKAKILEKTDNLRNKFENLWKNVNFEQKKPSENWINFPSQVSRD